jgi:DNA-binding winged helix-turn-helix (wHTH) protein
MTTDRSSIDVQLKFGEYAIDLRRKGLYRGEEHIGVNPKSFETLTYLAQNAGRTVSKEELLKEVWRGDKVPNVVEQAVSDIRRALGDPKANPKFLRTLPGKGYCFIAEIDLGTVDSPRPDENSAHPIQPVPAASEEHPSRPTEDQARSPAQNRITRRVLVLSASAAVGLGSFFLLGRKASPERAVLNGKLLTAMDGLGRTLWTHTFDHGPARDPESWQTQVVDLEGSGRPGVIAVCNFADDGGGNDTGRGELFYFRSDGIPAWKLVCRPAVLDYDSRPFEFSWNCSSMIVTREQRVHTIWVGIRHGWRWPGLVMRVDSRGEARVHVANAGHVQCLSYLENATGRFLVFSGINNAVDRPCIGLVEMRDPPSVAPMVGPARYRFVNGPTHPVRNYLLFPSSELDSAHDAPYGNTGSLRTHPGGILVEVGYEAYFIQYSLTEDLHASNASPSGSYPIGHRHFEEKGILHHSWADCPELKRPIKVRRFDRNDGWRDESVSWRLPTT